MSDASLICPQCGHYNLLNSKLCVRCQHLFTAETSEIKQTDEIASSINWGTKTLDKKLFMHVHGSSQSIEIPLEEGIEMIIGRYDPIKNAAPHVDLSNYNAAEKGVSRNHALMLYDNGSIKIADLGSPNFTYLNGQKLMPNQSRILRDGDELRLGKLLLTIQFG